VLKTLALLVAFVFSSIFFLHSQTSAADGTTNANLSDQLSALISLLRDSAERRVALEKWDEYVI
jgi:hypothetical protein